MGRGSYTSNDWAKLKRSKNISSTTSENEIFKKKTVDARFDPKYVGQREAFDSEDHPNTTPIIIGLDVTASMGYLAQKIATEALNETMMKLYSTNPVSDPALMFAAYGDVLDQAPLQVTQFESDIRIAEQLMDLWLENHGSGFVVPQLLWYFAAIHTKIDSINKRGKKGFLFTIGDQADCRGDNSVKDCIARVFHETAQLTSAEMVRDASTKYELFHIFINDIGAKGMQITQLLPGRTMVISKSDIDALPEIIISTMQLVNGESEIKILDQWSDLKRPIVQRAIRNLQLSQKNAGLHF